MPTATFRLTQHDIEIVGSLAQRLGVSRGDVVRLALRSFDHRVNAAQDGLEAVIAESAPSREKAVA